MNKIISLKAPAIIAIAALLVFSGFAGGYYSRERMVEASVKQVGAEGLSDVYEVLKQSYDGDLDEEKLREGAKAGLVAAAGDPYTVYLNADAAKKLKDDLSGTLSGIGAEVGIRNQKLVIIAPISDSPAAKAGLRPNDQIVRINEEDPSGLSLEEAVSKIRGEKGTTVKLTIIRGNEAPKEISITRDVITVASVKWSLKEGNTGYIQLTRFGDDTAALVGQAASELKAQGAKSIILDMRNNSGGYLNAAVDVSSEFLERGKLVVEERSKSDDNKAKLTSTGSGKLEGMKTIVLINEGSASASEIVAGALRDNKAATLVGQKSFGKGSVQEIRPLGGGAQLKVTIARWYTPNGTNINKDGIKPEIEVKLEQADYDAGRDPQLDKALELARK